MLPSRFHSLSYPIHAVSTPSYCIQFQLYTAHTKPSSYTYSKLHIQFVVAHNTNLSFLFAYFLLEKRFNTLPRLYSNPALNCRVGLVAVGRE
jgi:hypothetical protein